MSHQTENQWKKQKAIPFPWSKVVAGCQVHVRITITMTKTTTIYNVQQDNQQQEPLISYEPLSELLISPLINPLVVPM